MSQMKAYEEIVEFIASGTTPRNVVAFRPSDEAKERVADLIQREERSEISPEEESELNHYLQLEHLMHLAKARAQQHIDNG
jgi:GTP-dependent phosphoenolpyruvate carboxykinase